MVIKRTGLTYGLNNPLQEVFPSPVISQRNPTSNDRGYKLGQGWVDELNQEAFTLVNVSAGVATWILTASGTAVLATLTGDSGGAISPSGANINLLGGDTLNIDGSGNTLTVNTSDGGYPISPFVVGSTNTAGYETIQLAIDAAVALGGQSATIYVQPGDYPEDLDFSGTTVFAVGISIVGAVGSSDQGQVDISGTHTPPSIGGVVFRNLLLSDATAIFSSVVAGSAFLSAINCEFAVTNGFAYDLLNWTGTLVFFNTIGGIDDDGFINNTGGATLLAFSSGIGAGTANTMVVSGSVTLGEVDIGCPVSFGTGSNINGAVVQFGETITFAGNSTGQITYGQFTGGASPSITMSSSADIIISKGIVDSTNVPAIDGAGAGTLNVTGTDFINDTTFAAALTVSGGTTSSEIFETLNQVTGLQIEDNGISSDGTATDIDINLTPKGTGDVVASGGNIVVKGDGNQLQVKGGAATDFTGQVTLVLGTITIANTNIAAADHVIVTREGIGATTVLGILDVSIIANTSFTITSLQLAVPGSTQTNDVSIVNYFIVRQV